MPNCSFQDARTACITYEAVNELDIQSMKISNTSVSRHDELQSQGQSNFRPFTSDPFTMLVYIYKRCLNKELQSKSQSAKCLKCGKIGHIQSVCKATVHFASSNTRSCNLDPNNSDVPSDHLSLSTILKGNTHIQKRLYTSLGSFHDFIVDTCSIETIISFKNLKYLDPNFVVKPTEVSILGITGHILPIRGCYESLIRDDNSSYIPCEFLVSETGLSILGPKNLKRLEVELSFLVSNEYSDTLLIYLIATCAKCSEGMKIQPISTGAIRKGWTANLKRRFPTYFSKRDELSTTPDGILCLNDRVVIPTSLRKSVLENLHSGHLGVEKMKSLARLTCWWPEYTRRALAVIRDLVELRTSFVPDFRIFVAVPSEQDFEGAKTETEEQQVT
ncbi:unnamed protein product [Schistosoma margrebowiei]|uniref:Uncharacterized protein n=1 Tax=Schistosoma margrebowiei TaxID=48269 RepID=A0A183MI60_9TREM|nr:unnamed protein product [Schistosoma margrebowiei]